MELLDAFSPDVFPSMHAVELNQRKREDFAQMMFQIAETKYPDADKIILVADNLNTHSYASFYEPIDQKVPTGFHRSMRYTIHPNTVVG